MNDSVLTINKLNKAIEKLGRMPERWIIVSRHVPMGKPYQYKDVSGVVHIFINRIDLDGILASFEIKRGVFLPDSIFGMRVIDGDATTPSPTDPPPTDQNPAPTEGREQEEQ